MKIIEKIKAGVKENKKYIIIILVLWVILSIVLIAPLACSIKEATTANRKL